jgi:hypothetical protein
LGHANKAGGSFYSNAITNAEDESWIYYNHRKQDMGSLYVESSTASDHEQSLRQSSIRGILAWRKRKLSFISAKPKSKGEPLLKKDCGEGGDDIDFDRRQLSSSDESSSGVRINPFAPPPPLYLSPSFLGFVPLNVVIRVQTSL